MDEIIKALMLQMVQQYAGLSMYAIQKTVLSARNPQQWRIDNAFSGIINNLPQYGAQASQPLAQLNQGIDLQGLLGMLAQGANTTGSGTQTAPPQTITHNGATYTLAPTTP